MVSIVCVWIRILLPIYCWDCCLCWTTLLLCHQCRHLTSILHEGLWQRDNFMVRMGCMVRWTWEKECCGELVRKVSWGPSPSIPWVSFPGQWPSLRLCSIHWDKMPLQKLDEGRRGKLGYILIMWWFLSPVWNAGELCNRLLFILSSVELFSQGGGVISIPQSCESF